MCEASGSRLSVSLKRAYCSRTLADIGTDDQANDR
jgi:hypothetical protein